jgi:PAS domain S-box-containing protein
MDDEEDKEQQPLEELEDLKRKIAKLEMEKAQWVELEMVLKESENQYRHLVEESQLGIFIDDRDGDFLYCNERVPEIFGMTMEEFISQHPSDRILPEDWEMMKDYHGARMEGRTDIPSNYEFRARTKDSSIIDLEVSVVVLKEGENIKGTMSYIKDITERKRAEEELRQARDELEKVVEERTRELKVANYTLARDLEKRLRVEKALRESEDYYRRIVETLHDTLLIFDPEGEIILDANQRACEMYGYPKEELVGMSLAKMTKDVGAGKDKIITTLKQGHYNNFETVHFRKDGSEIFLEVNASVVEHKGKKVIVTVLRDKTEQRETMEAMKKSEEEYRTIIQRASDGILIIQDEVVKFANPKLVEIADTSVEDIIGKKFTDYVHPDEIETLVKNYERRMAGEEFDSIYRTKLKRANGEFLDAEINAGMITFEDKPADLVFVREIKKRNDA